MKQRAFNQAKSYAKKKGQAYVAKKMKPGPKVGSHNINTKKGVSFTIPVGKGNTKKRRRVLDRLSRSATRKLNSKPANMRKQNPKGRKRYYHRGKAYSRRRYFSLKRRRQLV